MRLLIALALILVTGVAHATSCAPDFSLDVKNDAPKGELVYLRQSEGFDPFRFFKDGLDLAAENPLVISNAEEIEIYVGGRGFENGEVDGQHKFKVVTLDYGSAVARFLITARIRNTIMYQILINIDRARSAAHVFMRRRDEGIWPSRWALAATYGNVPPTRPPTDAGRGLIGTDEAGRRRLLTVGRTAEELTLDLHDGATPDTPVGTRIEINERIRRAVADGDLKAFEGISWGNEDGCEARFRLNFGELSVRIYDQGRQVNLTDMVAWRASASR